MTTKCRMCRRRIDARTRKAGGEVCFDCATTENPPVRVIFRIYRDGEERGEVIAIFPDIPATNQDGLCLAYVHMGQHTAASYAHILEATDPAAPEEYASLRRELEGAPYHYRLIVRRRRGRR